MLDLKKLEENLDAALAKETKESLSAWLSKKREAEIKEQYREIEQSAEHRYPGVSELIDLQNEFNSVLQKMKSVATFNPIINTSNSSAPTR